MTRQAFGLSRFIACILWGMLSLSAAHAANGIDAVVIPTGSASASAAEANQVATLLGSLPDVLVAEPVFDAGERTFLIHAGKSDLAASVRLKLSSLEAFERIRKWLDLAPVAAKQIFPDARPFRGRIERNARAGLKDVNAATTPHPEQWALSNTGAPQQVEITDILFRTLQGRAGEDAGVRLAPSERSDRKILVAVLDTGVDAEHASLSHSIHRTPSECQSLAAYKECIRTSADKNPCHEQFANLDSDGNGYPLDCSGWSVIGAKDPRTGIRGSNEPTDDIGHGTHVSGILGATGFISGVATQVEILPVRVMGRSEGAANEFPPIPGDGAPVAPPAPDPHSKEFIQDGAFADTVARGVLYALRSGAKVINLSLGYSIHEDSEVMRRTIELAQERGILIVAAAGNQSSRAPVYPCRYAGVVCVASFSADGSLSHFSDYGDAVDVAAPGLKIMSTWPMKLFPDFFNERRGYEFLSGTSMASPSVAGLLARLLNAGFSPRESYARLVLGTRPHQTTTGMPELVKKFTLSGNVDLTRAFSVTPQPLILPAIKEPSLVALDRVHHLSHPSASIQVALKNFWINAENVSVEARLDPTSDVARAGLRFADGKLSKTISFTSWKSNETQKFEAELSLQGVSSLMSLAGDFYLDFHVSSVGTAARSFRKAVEFVVPVRPQLDRVIEDPAFTRISTDLGRSALSADYAFKPIGCIPSSLVSAIHEDLLLIGRSPRFTQLNVLRSSTESGERTLKKQGAAMLDTTKERLFAFSCLDRDRDGSRDYAVTTVNVEAKKFVMTMYDSAFRRGAQLEVSTDTVAMVEEFRWLDGAMPGAASPSGLTPAWIARGRMPQIELPGFDPWERRPADVLNPLDMRLYLLGSTGLRTLKAPEGFRYVSFFKPTLTELREGSASVLLYKGQDYQLDFYVSKLEGLKFSEPQSLSFSIYHRIAGLMTLPVFGGTDGVSATAFIEKSASGAMRVSLKPSEGRSNSVQSTSLRPMIFEPLKPGDTIENVIGLFGESTASVSGFFRSRFEMYYYDATSGQTISTDLKQYDSTTRHLPTRLGGQPALLMPEGQGSGIATEVIVPQWVGRDSNGTKGKLTLVRPAALKTLGVGCEQIQMLSTSQNGSGGGYQAIPESLIYYCGDHFLRIAL